ncbi:MAG: dihydroneopterin aldolase [Campylobacter sp.]|nr:dihydroneopterin aldolase [Campylobacter sp.]
MKLCTLIKDFEFSTIIGMLDFERTNPQKVRINAEFQSSEFIDYIQIMDFIQSYYNDKKFQSVEESLKEVSKALKEIFSNLISLKIEILKIQVVNNAHVGARLEIIY